MTCASPPDTASRTRARLQRVIAPRQPFQRHAKRIGQCGQVLGVRGLTGNQLCTVCCVTGWSDEEASRASPGWFIRARPMASAKRFASMSIAESIQHNLWVCRQFYWLIWYKKNCKPAPHRTNRGGGHDYWGFAGGSGFPGTGRSGGKNRPGFPGLPSVGDQKAPWETSGRSPSQSPNPPSSWGARNLRIGPTRAFLQLAASPNSGRVARYAKTSSRMIRYQSPRQATAAALPAIILQEQQRARRSATSGPAPLSGIWARNSVNTAPNPNLRQAFDPASAGNTRSNANNTITIDPGVMCSPHFFSAAASLRRDYSAYNREL